MRTWTLAAAFVAAALAAVSLAHAAAIEPGNWEFTVNMKAKGLGAFQPKPGPVVKNRCIGAEEASNPAKILSDAAARGECALSNQRDTGTEFSFDMKCTGRVPAHGTAKMRYSAQTLDGNVDLDGEAQGLRFSTKSQINARRTGPCNS